MVLDRDAFWQTFEPFLFVPGRIAATPEQVSQVVTLLRLRPGQRVLDLCCGPGRFSLELARRGFRVTGVDRTRSYLRRARKAAAREHLDIEFVQADMRRFVQAGAFDACISVFTSFGYFRSQPDDLRVCRNVFRSLRPGGAFLIEILGKEGLARRFQARDWFESGDALLLQERRPVDGWSGLEQRWILIRRGRVRTFRLWLRLYSAVELCRLLSQAGFRSVKAFGGFDGTPYDDAARRLVVVGRKPRRA